MCEEEERLRQEREQEAGPVADPPTSAKEAVLSKERFKQLDALLNRTGMYTQFLTEQLAVISEKPTAKNGAHDGVGGSGQEGEEAEGSSDGTVRKGKGKAAKRKGGKGAGQASKRQKKDVQDDAPSDGVSPTKPWPCPVIAYLLI
ncbi:hypothetical protein MNEG_13277 [Monoraphidium neglectum]|uniref:Uncharacterized protein n=1 Tax=Monoraphidium neglectum TaxID=145388 RepID=A0A0D2LZ79_9CHLO|nr:hypothetical protein MNEG_13277 [Monoraphidium neglectum]KIY94686.1 hypothetical protein MNEG_13277 [Monoraphidium neglectum]|eukprot:XP_013893706.1 hypothetical protein MNEG_13277 [Monoraphidium neglectum]